jgi:hypothetical protein
MIPKSGLNAKNKITAIGALAVPVLTHGGRVTQIGVFNTVKLGTSASSP